ITCPFHSSFPMAASLARVSSVPSTRSLPHVLYTEGHRQIQKSLSQLIEKEINPHVDEWERQSIFPAHTVFRKLGSLGVFGANKPTEYGGLGLDFSYSCAISETMGSIHCGAIPMAVSVQSDMSTPVLSLFGSESLKREFLLPSISGDLVSCIAVSEPEAGSDVAAIKTSARLNNGGDWVLNGQKMWITNGGQADWACVLANTNDSGNIHRNKSLFCVRLDSPGIHRSTSSIRKLGMHSSDTAEIFFDEVIVPAANLIGEEGRGFVYQMMQFQDERLVTVAVSLEPLQRCIDLTLDYTRERKCFGKPILDNQAVQFRLSELQAELESLRALLYRAVAERVLGSDVTLLASMAKLKCGRLSREITDCCLQYFGGYGFTWDCPITRMHRDLRLFSIGAGTDEMMLSIVSRHLMHK
ncbi:hypothetical protein PFISCL1PPCAC_10393, partial [Pristionchus fissidentatus]